MNLLKIIKEAINELEDDYRGVHTAPTKEDAPMNDLTGTYPEDIYTAKGTLYYGDGFPFDNIAHSIIVSARNKPNKQIIIYRAVPKVLSNEEKIWDYKKQQAYIHKYGKIPPNVDNWKDRSEYYGYLSDEIDKLSKMPEEDFDKIKISDGDWVTIDLPYAKVHGDSNLGKGKYRILRKTVPAHNLYTDGNSMHEWGYNI